MSLDRAALAAAIADHGSVTRVVIVQHAGSTPRETGTAMLVWGAGETAGQSGTIGGGTLEFQASARGRALAEKPGPWCRQLLRQPLGPALGQCCGGSVTLLLEVFTAAELAQIPESGAFARPVTPGEPSVSEAPLSIRNHLRSARAGQGDGTALVDGWFIEPVSQSATPLWIWGAGHVGRALVATLADLPFQITWVDDSRARFPDTIPPHVDMLVAARPQDAVRHAPDSAHHFVLTYSHALDLDLCHAILSRPAATLGLIGSATKRARFLSRLKELGHGPADLARLTCPIGDPALGKQPQAIAISVAHRLLKEISAQNDGATNREHVA